MRTVMRAACLAGLFWAAAGCAAKKYPIHGRVTTEDGKPVTEGIVVFESVPADGALPVMARGRIQPDGTYALSTEKPGDGVPGGKYRALLVPPEPDVDGPAKPPAFDKRYTAYATSGLAYEVGNGPTEIVIMVAAPPGRAK